MLHASAQDRSEPVSRGAPDVIFEDDFDEPHLDQRKWVPYYLPHWSSLDASAARYRIDDSILRLYIGPDQPLWWSDPKEAIKVSGLQTGHFAGPLNSPHGQHRFRPGLRVQDVLATSTLFLPQYCRLEMKARARLKPWNLAALWLIGFEDQPERSGEITLFEVFGDRALPGACHVGRGVKRLNDPALHDEIDDGPLAIDVEDWHVYAMDWTPTGIVFSVDDQLVTETAQSPDYPMQLMLNMYDLRGDEPHAANADAWFDIDYIRSFRPT